MLDLSFYYYHLLRHDTQHTIHSDKIQMIKEKNNKPKNSKTRHKHVCKIFYVVDVVCPLFTFRLPSELLGKGFTKFMSKRNMSRY